jgi:hypothetical protein
MPNIRRVPTLQRRSAGDPLYIDSLPRTVKQLPINRGCSRHDFSFAAGAGDCAGKLLLAVRRNRIARRMNIDSPRALPKISHMTLDFSPAAGDRHECPPSTHNSALQPHPAVRRAGRGKERRRCRRQSRPKMRLRSSAAQSRLPGLSCALRQNVQRK